MGKKLVVVAHGVGVRDNSFFTRCKSVLEHNHAKDKFDLVELYWGDVLEKVEEKYPIIEKDFASVLTHFDIDVLKQALGSNAYTQFMAHIMDVLVYVALSEMRQYILDTCTERLSKLTRSNGTDRSGDTILIGHSLGTAILSHVVWAERQATANLPYYGLILLSPVLGYESPMPALVDDFLRILGQINGGNRLTTLKRFAGAWSFKGSGRLRLLINRNDIICSDVKVRIGNIEADIIPVRQGLDAQEEGVLVTAHKDCICAFAEGTPDAITILKNHEVELYLNRPEFKTTFDTMLGG